MGWPCGEADGGGERRCYCWRPARGWRRLRLRGGAGRGVLGQLRSRGRRWSGGGAGGSRGLAPHPGRVVSRRPLAPGGPRPCSVMASSSRVPPPQRSPLCPAGTCFLPGSPALPGRRAREGVAFPWGSLISVWAEQRRCLSPLAEGRGTAALAEIAAPAAGRLPV